MFSLRSCVLFAAMAAGLIALPVFAANDSTTSKIDLTALAKAQATHQILSLAAHQNAQAQVTPKAIFANPSRAYPPSCLGDGLPLGGQGSGINLQTAQVTLPGDPLSTDSNEQAYSETVTISVWRVACSGAVSATVVEIDRPSTASATYYPVFPSIYIIQGGTDFAPRLPEDENTFYSDTAVAAPLYGSSIWVFENYFGISSPPNYNQAFTVYIDNLMGGTPLSMNFPAYTAPAAAPMEISGYISGPWYQPGKGGEGILVQVYDNGDEATRTFAATWYTFDSLGIPFWLYAQTSVNIGATAVNNAPVYYQTGGGFAGNFVSSNQYPWGTMSVSFPNCNSMVFTYSGSTPQVTGGPAGHGTLTWTRLANINGLACQ